MKIGVPKEIKPQENRIGLTPESVKTLTSNGHEVLIENNGGFEAGFDNDQYKSAGAKIIDKSEDINVDISTIFTLINNVDGYKSFLPWCKNSTIISNIDNVPEASCAVENLRDIFSTNGRNNVISSLSE